MLPGVLRKYFPVAKTLYDILGCTSDANAADLKKSYYKAALKYHPDKAEVSGDPEATGRFQALGVAHEVLSDPARRKEYDETGEVELNGEVGGGEGSASFASSYAYWRAQFPGFTVADIESFASRYRGGEEELEDLLEAYTLCKGDMDGILESVPCCSDADEDRFVAAIHEAISGGRVKNFKAFTTLYGGTQGGGGVSSSDSGGKRSAALEKSRNARAEKTREEAREAESYLKTLQKEHAKKTGGKVGEASLEAMIRARAEERSSGMGGFLKNLEEKYTGGGGGRAGKCLLEDDSTGAVGSVKKSKTSNSKGGGSSSCRKK